LSVKPVHGGLLDLGFAVAAGGTTRLVRRAQRFPIHFTAPLYLDPGRPDMAFVYVQNPTGGVLAGDRLRTAVAAGPAATVHLTTTSATKIYRMDEGDAVQEIDLELEEDAFVEYLPEPLIPQAGSRYEQRTNARLSPSACLILGETVSPGRVARGESFAYDKLELATRICTGDEEVCSERILLEPARRPVDGRGLLDGYGYVSTLYAVAPSRDADRIAAALDEALRDAPGVLAGAGTLPGGIGALARLLSPSSSAMSAALVAAWSAARRLLIGHPPPRRRK
jgi:urease accessory protein